MSIFDGQPAGFTLIRADGRIHNRIRGDMIPRKTIVIVQDGRSFVRTWTKDDDRFAIYREGFQTVRYQSRGE